MSTTELQTQLYTVRQFSKRHQWISESGLRWLLFNRKSNGLEKSGAIIMLGRKLLIDEAKFLGWVRHQGQDRAAVKPRRKMGGTRQKTHKKPSVKKEVVGASEK